MRFLYVKNLANDETLFEFEDQEKLTEELEGKLEKNSENTKFQ